MKFKITLCAVTTMGSNVVETEAIDTWDEAAAHLDGVVAAIGQENLIYALIRTERSA